MEQGLHQEEEDGDAEMRQMSVSRDRISQPVRKVLVLQATHTHTHVVSSPFSRSLHPKPETLTTPVALSLHGPELGDISWDAACISTVQKERDES